MHPTNSACADISVALLHYTRRFARVAYIFHKSNFTELCEIAPSLLINEDVAFGRGGSEVILVASVEQKGEDQLR